MVDSSYLGRPYQNALQKGEEREGLVNKKRFLVIKYVRRWLSETGGERRLEGIGRRFKGLHHHL